MDINTLAELVNAETVGDLKSIESIKPEEIKGEVLNSEETVRKIEERRRSVTSESQSRSSGLRSEARNNASSVRGSEPRYASYTNSSSYTYGRTQQTIESRAREYSNHVFKKAMESAKKESKKDIWNMFELDEREKMKNKKIKPVNKKYDKLKLNLLYVGGSILKGLMEDLYISLNNDRK